MLENFLVILLQLLINVIQSFFLLITGFLSSLRDLAIYLNNSSPLEQFLIISILMLLTWFVLKFFISSMKSLIFIGVVFLILLLLLLLLI